MDLAAPGGIGSEHTARQLTHTLRIMLTDQSANVILHARTETAVLTVDPVSREPIILGRVYPNEFKVHVPSNPELLRILEVNPQINLHVRLKSDQQLVMTGQVFRPEPIQIVLRNEASKLITPRLSPVVEKVSASSLPPLLQAVSQVNAQQVSQALQANHLHVDRNLVSLASSGEFPGHAKLPSELAKSVVQSIRTVGGDKPMLIPDISAAVPRAIAPDALPTSVPIRQPIAGELGLKPGEVVQALVASSGGKMALQLGQYQLPLSAQARLPEGQISMRVIQTKEGLALVPQLSQQPQASQALSTSGLSAALAAILTRNTARPQIQSLFAPQGLEGLLTAVGLTDEAKRLNANRLQSDQLNGDLVKSAIQFGALGNEKALLEGVALQGGILKPWLRQILRLLPQQSELTSRIAGLVTELESLQIEALPQSHGRESGLAVLLLLRDQPPVELLFERKNVTDRDKTKHLWILNLHTSLDSLGEVWLKSSFSGKNIDLTFWAKEEQTATLAKKSKMDLEEALTEHDLHVKSMQIFASPRPGFEKLSSEGIPHLDAKA